MLFPPCILLVSFFIALPASGEFFLADFATTEGSLGLREGYARVVACPTCGRVEVDVVALASRVEELARDLPADKVISVMGCIVNGPGEAKAADLGIAAGRTKVAIYREGELHRNISKDELETVLIEEIERLKK